MTSIKRRLRKLGIPIYLALAPILILLVLFRIWPTLNAFWLSMTNANMLNLERAKFVGFRNYSRLFTLDPVFWGAVKNTLIYAFSTAFLGLPLALLVALGLEKSSSLLTELGLKDKSSLRLRRFFTFFYFAPYVTPIVAICVLFTWMFQRYGLFNIILEQAGLPPQPFITESSHALPSLIGMVIWRDMGFGIVMYLVGLLGIPRMYYEAAKVDGAKSWNLFRHITLPLLTRTTQFVAVMNLINGFIAFTAMKVITNGGPGKATTVMTIQIYDNAIVSHKIGYGSSVAVVLFVIIMIITLIQLKILRAKWEY